MESSVAFPPKSLTQETTVQLWLLPVELSSKALFQSPAAGHQPCCAARALKELCSFPNSQHLLPLVASWTSAAPLTRVEHKIVIPSGFSGSNPRL